MLNFLAVKFKIKNIQILIDGLILIPLLAALGLGVINHFLLTLAFIFLHESSHILAAIICGIKVYSVRILPVGMNAEIDDTLCGRAVKVFIYSAGPAVNIIMAAVIFIFFRDSKISININLALAVFNLLPILPLDGGKLAMELLSGYYGLFGAGRRMKIFTLILSVVIIIMGSIALSRSLLNISLVFIGIYILFYIKEGKKETAFMNIRNFIYKRSDISKKGIYPVRHIAVLKHVKISEMLKAMDHKDKFHIINVLDEELRIIKSMTEQEFLNAVMQCSPDTTFDKLTGLEYNGDKRVN